ncbi:hypothetical protein [Tumebacillus flagellatus]|uniref:Uncharacterized protein n=1 Tax=Tumebacillus flagellatus TaxID=1157490 RepID=A0A074LQ57_9BACL|nr:hypothetical protein [Tumebacillus flagellatus]KEO82595.1 hypothetical protein EL26_14515 [Tumebacillus flagellatus]
MNTVIVQAILTIGLVLLLEWRLIKREPGSTRLLYFSMLGLSCCIWIYLGAVATPVRPSTWLEHLLAPVALLNVSGE